MGMTNSPATFQRLMQTCLNDFIFQILLMYLQSATKLVETLCKQRTLAKTLLLFSKKNSRKSTFAGIPSPSLLINVVPLLLRVLGNRK